LKGFKNREKENKKVIGEMNRGNLVKPWNRKGPEISISQGTHETNNPSTESKPPNDQPTDYI